MIHIPSRALRCAASFLLAAVLGASASAQTMFRGDPAHTGVLQTKGPKQLKGVKWRFLTGNCIVASPVLSNGVVFIGSDDSNFYAIDQATGKEKWKFKTGSVIRSTAAIQDGLVIFSSYDGNVYTLDEATGKERWRFAIPGERKYASYGLHYGKPSAQFIPDFWDLYQSSPTISGGMVYFGAGDGLVHALELATGAEKWRFATHDVVHSSPAVVDGVLYIGSYDRNFYALDAKTGALKWSFATGADHKNHNLEGIQSSPCVKDGTVYFGCRDRNMYALDAATGKEKWRCTLTWLNASPAIHDGVLYGASSIPAFFIAYDTLAGKEAYKIDLKVPAFSSPAIADGFAYVGSFSGKFYAIDLKEKKIAWEFATDAHKAGAAQYLTAEGAFNSPAIFKSSFFEDTYASAYRIFSLGSFVSSPAVADGVVYVGSSDGALYALE